MIIQMHVGRARSNGVQMNLIRSLTQPSNPAQGDIWVNVEDLTVNNIFFLGELDPNAENTFEPNSLYFYRSVVGEDPESVNYILFDFGNGLTLEKEIACFILTDSSGMQIADYDIEIYSVLLEDYVEINTVKLPIILNEDLNIFVFIGSEITGNSLFETLSLDENVSLEAEIEGVTEQIVLENFLGNAIPTISLFDDALQIEEDVTIVNGGTQIYP